MDPNAFFQGAVAFVQKYGLLAIICGAIVAGLTEAIKIPIYKAGVKYQEKTGIDKSGITWLITLVSLALSFGIALLVCFYLAKWDYSQLDWPDVSAKSATTYAAATAEYEIVKKIIKGAQAVSAASKAKKAADEASSNALIVINEEAAKPTVVTKVVKPAEKAEAQPASRMKDTR